MNLELPNWQTGDALIGVAMLAMLAVCVVIGCESTRPAAAAQFPDITDTTPIAFYSTRTHEYNRPPWKRFLYSIRPYTETVTANGQAHIDTHRLTYAGSYLDNAKPAGVDWLPQSYAVGATGGLEF